MNRQTLFLGCVIPLRFPGIEVAARRVFRELGVDCVELEGYSCCPEPVVLGLADKELGIAVSARNLSLAEEAGADLVVLCNGCFETLVEADAVLRHDEAVRSNVTQVLAAIGRRYEGKIKIKHFIEFLHEDVGTDRIRKTLKRPMDVAVACHYGCHLFRETAGLGGGFGRQVGGLRSRAALLRFSHRPVRQGCGSQGAPLTQSQCIEQDSCRGGDLLLSRVSEPI